MFLPVKRKFFLPIVAKYLLSCFLFFVVFSFFGGGGGSQLNAGVRIRDVTLFQQLFTKADSGG